MKHKKILTSLAVLVATAATLAVITPKDFRVKRAAGRATVATAHPNLAKAWGQLPLSFEVNQGQTDAQVKYLSHGAGYGVFLTKDAAVLSLMAPKGETAKGEQPGRGGALAGRQMDTTAGRLRRAGANSGAEVKGLEKLPGHVNYFIGNVASKWHTGVPTYAKVEYAGVYPGVDLVFHGNQKQLEYDFDVAAGADATKIALDIDGAQKVRIAADGTAVVETRLGEVVLHQPVSYQMIAGQRKMVASSYEMRGAKELVIHLGAYDASEALVIDPTLTYSTYIGGSQEDNIYAVAADTNGNAYVAGLSNSTNYPIVNGIISGNPSGGATTAGVVSEINAAGSALVFSTYLGGSGNGFGGLGNGDAAYGIAVDAAGNVYVTGGTVSTNFPVTSSGFQQSLGSFSSSLASENAFLSVLSAGGITLSYSTYIGGSVSDLGTGVDVDGSGNAYVVGGSFSPDFPVTGNAFQTFSPSSLESSGFLTKVATTQFGSASLVYSTYIGGSSNSTSTLNPYNYAFSDAAFGVAADGAGNAYITGQTTSSDFPVSTSGAFQAAYGGGNADAFVIELNTVTGGADLSVYSTYLGGNLAESGSQVKVDAVGDAYVVGTTNSPNFPTLNPAQAALGGISDAFVTELKTGGWTLDYSTYLGGTGGDYGLGIAIDSNGQAYVGGSTFSSNFPVTSDALQSTNKALGHGQTNGFLTIAPAGGGSAFVYSTYFGGSGASGSFNAGDSITGVAVDSSTNIYIGGTTASSDFMTLNPEQPTLAGLDDGFISKFSNTGGGTIMLAPSTLDFGTVTQGSSSAPMSVTLTNNSGATLTVTAIPFSGANATDFSETDTCVGTPVANGGTCTINVVFTPSTTAPESATMGVTSSPSTTATVALSGVGTGGTTTVTVSPLTLTFPNTPINTGSAAMNVTLTNTGTVALSVSGVTFSGTNASDYTQSNACTNIAAGSTCMIAVIFTPHQSGASTASMSIADNAADSPQAVALAGTGTDFSAPTLSPATLTLTAGSSGMFTATVVPTTGFVGAVTFTCTGVPTLSTCTSGTPVVNPDGSTTATLSITTTARGFAPPMGPQDRPTGGLPGAVLPAMLTLLLAGAAYGMKRKAMPALASNRVRTLGLIAALALFGGMAACSSSSTSNNGTPAGTYPLMVTATSGNVSHSSTFTLIVQ